MMWKVTGDLPQLLESIEKSTWLSQKIRGNRIATWKLLAWQKGRSVDRTCTHVIYCSSILLVSELGHFFFFLSFATNKYTIQEFRAKMALSELLMGSFTWQKAKENAAREGYEIYV